MGSDYAGRVLRIDLSARSVETQIIADSVFRSFLGGNGICAYLMAQEAAALDPPLSPCSPLIFATGPLTGTRAPGSGRYAVAGRSPLTGIWGDSDSGGHWGERLKGTGFDALVIVGRSLDPIYIWINDEGVTLRSAEGIWGRDTFDSQALLLAETDPNGSALCIGPSGEKLLPLACIITEGSHARAAGRCGLGAVMGSKNLKGIVASGTSRVRVADPGGLEESLKRVLPRVAKGGARLREFGTAGAVAGNAAIADMPAKNWTVGDWVAESKSIDGAALAAEFSVGRYRCPGCVVGCGRVVKIKTGTHAGTVAGGPEYETLAGFGAQCLVTDLAAIVELNDTCNREGLDTISTSAVAAFAFEAYERGILTDVEIGRPLRWGDSEALVYLVDQIAKQEGIGVLLAKGVREAAAALGHGSEEFALHVKGLEPPLHDPRALSSLAISYASMPRGACHRGCSHHVERFVVPELGYDKALDRFAWEDKARLVAAMQDYAEVFNCLKLCQFMMSSIPMGELVNWVNAITGWGLTTAELLCGGERSNNLKRMYNLQCGLSTADDSLPKRLLTEKLPTGGAADYLPPLHLMLPEYYEARAWDAAGIPTPDKLRDLGLNDVLPASWSRG